MNQSSDLYLHTFTTFKEQVQTARQQNRWVLALIPIGSIEQHGPWLPLGTDSLISESVAAAIVENLRPLAEPVVFPCLMYTHARSGAHFPGNITVSPELTRQMARELCQTLIDSGDYDAIAFINSHGPNYPSLTEVAFNLVFDQCQTPSGTPCPVFVINTAEGRQQFAQRYGIPSGKHGDWLEFLLVYHQLGAAYFEAKFAQSSMLQGMKQANEAAAQTPPEPARTMGIPIEERSFQGIIGQPFPGCETLDDLQQWATAYWTFTCENVTTMIQDGLSASRQWILARSQ